MNPRFFPFWDFFQLPFSGNVTQDNSPITSWLSPQFEFNFSGNRRIEAEVISEAASYGKQLGILTEAVLELAEGKPGESLERLQKLNDHIGDIKAHHHKMTTKRLRADLDHLHNNDRDTLKALLEEYK